ncbi:DNA-3-methyladenine glycosylase family protein [Mucilaginibacter terrae]|uniref:DNA-3-methyladenine glycosylase family protein n=1 Tax=Mucilaginibacter terrae TaxID=1955052 RepID=UPI0036287A1B
MNHSNLINLNYTGSYSLALSVAAASASAFVTDSPSSNQNSPTLDLTFALENSWKTISVRISQVDGELSALLIANSFQAGLKEIRTNLERILFLNTDGNAFESMVCSDEVLNQSWKRQYGLRPILFPTPFEAAARAIIGHQLPVSYAATVSDQIAREYGVMADLGDRMIHAFPMPEILAELAFVKGLAARKVEQLRALGKAAAQSDWLNSEQLKAMPINEALLKLQQLPGIGPFSAELILIRGAGHTDVFPKNELRLQRAMTALYHLQVHSDFKELESIAKKWQPFRSWAGLVIRNSVGKQ